MVGVGMHRLRPDPRRHNHRRRLIHQVHHRRGPPHPDQRPHPGLLHLPPNWPKEQRWDLLLTRACGPPPNGPAGAPRHPPAQQHWDQHAPPEHRLTGRSTTPQDTKMNLPREGTPPDPRRWIQIKYGLVRTTGCSGSTATNQNIAPGTGRPARPWPRHPPRIFGNHSAPRRRSPVHRCEEPVSARSSWM